MFYETIICGLRKSMIRKYEAKALFLVVELEK